MGRIGDLVLSWDRHEGGRLAVAQAVAGVAVPVARFATQAQLEGTLLRSDADPDPRLIPVEAGPHRLVVRVVQRLHDEDGQHLGDAVQETWAWADGAVHLAAMLRLLQPGRGGRLVGAGAELAFAEGWRVADADGLRLQHDGGWRVAVCRYRGGAPWAHVAGVDEPTSGHDRATWEVVDEPPFSRFWGPYYEQWSGTAGWSAVRLEGADAPVLRAMWAEGTPRDRGATACYRGLLAILGAADEETLVRRVRAFEAPLTPSVTGGAALYHSPMEGTTVVRRTASRATVTFPADPAQRQVRLQVRREPTRQPERVEGGDRLVLGLADSGLTDDPYGPNLVRPDDRHGPLLATGWRPPEEALTTVQLAADRPTEVRVAASPGLWLAAQRWDDRQHLLLWSSADARGPVGVLSLSELKLRHLRIPGDAESSMARLPLYWFAINAASAHFALNHPVAVDLVDNGPEAVRLRVVGRNPAGTAESVVEATIPHLEDQLRFDLRCRFMAPGGWDLPGIQYCNFFPEEERYPETWGSDRVLVMAEDGQHMRVDHRAPMADRVLAGRMFQEYEGRLFVALYGGPRGNVLALSQPRSTGDARLQYILCPWWLDNHFNLASGGDALAPGTRYEMDLTVVLAHTSNVDADMVAVGRRALATGVL